MTFSLAEQTLVFLQAILLGVISGVWYDICRALRRALRAGAFGTALADGVFWLTSLSCLFYFAVTEAAAQMRSYVLLGVGLGVLLYFLCFSPLLLSLMEGVLHVLIGIVKLPLQLGRRLAGFLNEKLQDTTKVTQIIKKLKKRLPFSRRSG